MVFTTRIDWEAELPEMKRRGSMGMTMTQLAKHYGVSRQRIKQIVDRYIPSWKDEYGYAVNRKVAENYYAKKWGVKEDTALYDAKRKKYRNKKAIAKSRGIPFDLDFGDIAWPSHCPVLGIELNYFAETREEGSVSFDKLEPSKGYVKDNVVIMSWRANRIKNDGTAEEHRSIAVFLDKHSY